MSDSLSSGQTSAERPEAVDVGCPYCRDPSGLGAVYYDQTCRVCVARMADPPPVFIATTFPAQRDEYAAGWRGALRACADYLDCIPEGAAGGDDEARRLVKMARKALGE